MKLFRLCFCLLFVFSAGNSGTTAPAEGTYKVPGFGVVKIGINELQDSGVQFVVCNAAMTVYSAIAAEKMKLKAEDVYNEWKSALLPGITPVPSGVWAVGRAQEYQCGYCYAG